MTALLKLLAEARKAVAAVVSMAANVVALGVLHGSAAHIVELVASIGGAIAVYLVPNAKPAAPPAPASTA